MKHKGQREIPDFATARPVHHPSGQPPVPRSAKPAPAPRPTVKPQATSAKSGRRGQ